MADVASTAIRALIWLSVVGLTAAQLVAHVVKPVAMGLRLGGSDDGTS